MSTLDSPSPAGMKITADVGATLVCWAGLPGSAVRVTIDGEVFEMPTESTLVFMAGSHPVKVRNHNYVPLPPANVLPPAARHEGFLVVCRDGKTDFHQIFSDDEEITV